MRRAERGGGGVEVVAELERRRHARALLRDSCQLGALRGARRFRAETRGSAPGGMAPLSWTSRETREIQGMIAVSWSDADVVVGEVGGAPLPALVGAHGLRARGSAPGLCVVFSGRALRAPSDLPTIARRRAHAPTSWVGRRRRFAVGRSPRRRCRALDGSLTKIPPATWRSAVAPTARGTGVVVVFRFRSGESERGGSATRIGPSAAAALVTGPESERVTGDRARSHDVPGGCQGGRAHICAS
jgi:hypothetical protein